MLITSRFWLIFATLIMLAGCSSTSDRYRMSHDAYPSHPPNMATIENAHPHVEPLSRAGNQDYSVNGQRYRVWRGIKHYQQIGMASWYGLKFHGHRTSNGEIYDMYSMSAANKHLPLPSYVRVTNLANQKSVIVRVNDRGPFHSKRIIDLSYAAAYKLGMLASGTTKVEVTLIDPSAPKKVAIAPIDNKNSLSIVQTDNFYVQLLAFKDTATANQQQRLLKQKGYPTVVVQADNWQKLRLGPYSSRKLAEQAKTTMRQGQYKDAFIVTIEHTN
ncbi:septal ring lytic transglycosylase RlpA family protein [Celerinatantimonas yamalensis]|uniref:Endolytic peptidoglycan transglycosylase RlpA n=1 Tax=Celerinatantimonas yamalensis TaxID=559956 RepID=A0ABW9G9H0_9GAMM